MVKNILLRGMAIFGLSLGLLVGFTTQTQASSTKTTIEKVSISIDSSNVEIGSGSRKIDVTSEEDWKYLVSNDSGKAVNMEGSTWSVGVTPRFSITIKPESGYKFDSSKTSKSSYYEISMRDGNPATFVKATGGSNSVTLTVRLPKLKGDTSNLGVSDLEWEENAKARWGQAESAQKYSVKLYKGSHLVDTVETSNTSYSFASKITTTGNYKFKVRATAYGVNGEWDVSDDYYIDDEELAKIKKHAGIVDNNNNNNNSNNNNNNNIDDKGTGTATWLKDSKGWWYCYPNRTYPKSTWLLIKNKWYYFNDEGYMYTGWTKYKEKWYYCGPDGDMWVNRTTPDGYKVDANGVWIQ